MSDTKGTKKKTPHVLYLPFNNLTAMSWPNIEPGPPRWEASTLEETHSNNVLIAIYILLMSKRLRKMLATTALFIIFF
jgi:hypothetical protein